MKKWIVFLFSALMASTVATAQEPQGFFEFAGGSFKYEEDDFSEDFSNGYLEARLGSMFSPYVGAQLRLGLGLGDDSVTVYDYYGLDIDVSLKLKNLLGANMIIGVPVAEKAFIYGVVGFARYEGEISATSSGGLTATEKYTETDTGGMFGLGVKLNLTEKASLVVDYSVINCDGCDMSSLTAGVGVKF